MKMRATLSASQDTKIRYIEMPIDSQTPPNRSENQKRRSSDTILFVAATMSFSGCQDRANGPFHQENEKLLAENDAASQAASTHET